VGELIILVMAHDVSILKFDIDDYSSKLAAIWPVSNTFEWPMPHPFSGIEPGHLSNILQSARFVTR
jgi:hypothetical protein